MTHVPDDRIRSEKQMVHWAADLLDTEAQEAFRIATMVSARYAQRPATAENLTMLRDEMLTRLAEHGYVAEIDISPFYHGEPPIVEIKGKVKDDPIHSIGFDHEQKEYEVKKALNRGEDYLGEKESANRKRKKK